MGYRSIADTAASYSLQRRVSACAAQEQITDPPQWTDDHMLILAAEPGWGEAWDSAVASGNPDPGGDESVITDGMILSGVQAVNGA